MGSDLSPRPQVAHYLSKGGFDAADKRSIRAVSLLAHKFIMDVADEAMQITSRRSSTRVAGAAAAACSLSPSTPERLVALLHSLFFVLATTASCVASDPLAAAGVKEEKPTLTIDVLMHALRQKGVNIYKPSIIKVRCAVATALAGTHSIQCCFTGFRGCHCSSSGCICPATSRRDDGRRRRSSHASRTQTVERRPTSQALHP